MKNFIKTIVFLIIFGILFLYIRSILWIDKNPFSYFYEEPKNTLDVVYIGASNVYQSFNTSLAYELYGYKTGLASTGDQMLPATTYILEEIRKYQEPKLYIIDLEKMADDTGEFVEEDIRRITDVIPFNQNRINLLKRLLEIKQVSKEEAINYYFSFNLYHNRWKELEETNFNETKWYKGYPLNEVNIGVNPQREYKWIDELEELPEETKKYFVELLDYCKENKLNVLFVIPQRPYKPGLNRRLNTEVEMIKQYGYDVINFNTLNDFSSDVKSEYMDLVHLNVYGATKHTIYFGRYLKEHYNLENVDKNDESWKSEYKRFKENFRNYTKKDFDEVLNQYLTEI